MIKRRYVVEVGYTPKSTLHNASLNGDSLARNIRRYYESQEIVVDVIAKEFVTDEDLQSVDEFLYPSKEEEWYL